MVSTHFTCAQLGSMFKKGTEAEPKELQSCHYGDRADGLSLEEWGNNKSKDKHTFTHKHTDTHLTDITVM